MDLNIQEAQGRKPYAPPRVTSQKLTLGVYGSYSDGDAVMRLDDPIGGTFSGSGGHRNSGSP